tara:strand:+ start:2532 stop:3236 length:705 start_codon:yes stop_codon:yes gene_type:complete
MKILNLYAGIGGNRKLWGDEHEITAVEINPEIAAIYKKLYPNDKVIVADAHQYLLEHHKEFDFIWSSPPCPTHSKMRFLKNVQENNKDVYPDMKLYEEIIFLKHFCKCKFVVENVNGYYEPLIKPVEIGRHYFWNNFNLSKIKHNSTKILRNKDSSLKTLAEMRDISPDIINVTSIDKRKVISNMVDYKIGKEIFNFIRLEKRYLIWLSRRNKQHYEIHHIIKAGDSYNSHLFL